MLDDWEVLLAYDNSSLSLFKYEQQPVKTKSEDLVNFQHSLIEIDRRSEATN